MSQTVSTGAVLETRHATPAPAYDLARVRAVLAETGQLPEARTALARAVGGQVHDSGREP